MSASIIQLQSHAIAPCPWVSALTVEVERAGDAISILFHVQGALSKIRFPTDNGGQRRDELWTTTCFEAFFRAPGEDQYLEFNFAPNGDWAAFRFDGYRANMADLDCPAPEIETQISDSAARVRVTLPDGLFEPKAALILFGPTAILEDIDGTRSFWAIHHALNKPDFHHIDTFKMTLD
ncbi:MAG: DOMON-like domain-containing protein [Henriciella sp.]|nr:DOMON-like domain-containing protein [Henriciella sp.]